MTILLRCSRTLLPMKMIEDHLVMQLDQTGVSDPLLPHRTTDPVNDPIALIKPHALHKQRFKSPMFWFFWLYWTVFMGIGLPLVSRLDDASYNSLNLKRFIISILAASVTGFIISIIPFSPAAYVTKDWFGTIGGFRRRKEWQLSAIANAFWVTRWIHSTFLVICANNGASVCIFRAWDFDSSDLATLVNAIGVTVHGTQDMPLRIDEAKNLEPNFSFCTKAPKALKVAVPMTIFVALVILALVYIALSSR